MYRNALIDGDVEEIIEKTSPPRPTAKCWGEVVQRSTKAASTLSQEGLRAITWSPNMKRFLFVAVLTAMTVPVLVAEAGVSVQVGEPGFYGSLDIGGFPQPQLIYAQPVLIEPVAVGAPMYLHVPPGHAKNWSKHCRKYNACGRPAYFVQDNWYNQQYVPRYRESRGGNGQNHGNGKGHGHDKGHGNGKGHDD